MPSTAAPRAVTPLPVSGRLETGAVTRPESDGATGPITCRSGSLGGGAEAGRGPGGAESLREAQARGGPAGGGEVDGPGGARRAGAVVGREVRPAAEAQGARRREGLEVGEFIPCWLRTQVRGDGCSRVVQEVPRLTRDLPVAARTRAGPSGARQEGQGLQENPRTLVHLEERLFTNYSLFTQGRNSTEVP